MTRFPTAFPTSFAGDTAFRTAYNLGHPTRGQSQRTPEEILASLAPVAGPEGPVGPQPAAPSEKSLLAKGGSVVLGGLAAAGGFLDLPGSTVRDILAGENPLDQWLPWNWFHHQGRTTGRELLRKHGMIGKKDTWGNFWGGLGAEIALDPLAYLNPFSAVNKFGKVMEKAGLLRELPELATQAAGRPLGRAATMRMTGEQVRNLHASFLMQNSGGKLTLKEATEIINKKLMRANKGVMPDLTRQIGTQATWGVPFGPKLRWGRGSTVAGSGLRKSGEETLDFGVRKMGDRYSESLDALANSLRWGSNADHPALHRGVTGPIWRAMGRVSPGPWMGKAFDRIANTVRKSPQAARDLRIKALRELQRGIALSESTMRDIRPLYNALIEKHPEFAGATEMRIGLENLIREGDEAGARAMIQQADQAASASKGMQAGVVGAAQTAATPAARPVAPEVFDVLADDDVTRRLLEAEQGKAGNAEVLMRLSQQLRAANAATPAAATPDMPVGGLLESLQRRAAQRAATPRPSAQGPLGGVEPVAATTAPPPEAAAILEKLQPPTSTVPGATSASWPSVGTWPSQQTSSAAPQNAKRILERLGASAPGAPQTSPARPLRYPRESRAAVYSRIAAEEGVDPRHLQEMAEEMATTVREPFEYIEEAKSYLRDYLGLDANAARRIENSGVDFTSPGIGGVTGRRLRKFDEIARDVDLMYPGVLNLQKHGGNIEAAAWDMLREGKSRIAQPWDEDVVRAAAQRLRTAMEQDEALRVQGVDKSLPPAWWDEIPASQGIDTDDAAKVLSQLSEQSHSVPPRVKPIAKQVAAPVADDFASSVVAFRNALLDATELRPDAGSEGWIAMAREELRLSDEQTAKILDELGYKPPASEAGTIADDVPARPLMGGDAPDPSLRMAFKTEEGEFVSGIYDGVTEDGHYRILKDGKAIELEPDRWTPTTTLDDYVEGSQKLRPLGEARSSHITLPEEISQAATVLSKSKRVRDAIAAMDLQVDASGRLVQASRDEIAELLRPVVRDALRKQKVAVTDEAIATEIAKRIDDFEPRHRDVLGRYPEAGGAAAKQPPSRMPLPRQSRDPLGPVSGEPLYDSLTGMGRRGAAMQPEQGVSRVNRGGNAASSEAMRLQTASRYSKESIGPSGLSEGEIYALAYNDRLSGTQAITEAAMRRLRERNPAWSAEDVQAVAKAATPEDRAYATYLAEWNANSTGVRRIDRVRGTVETAPMGRSEALEVLADNGVRVKRPAFRDAAKAFTEDPALRANLLGEEGLAQWFAAQVRAGNMEPWKAMQGAGLSDDAVERVMQRTDDIVHGVPSRPLDGPGSATRVDELPSWFTKPPGSGSLTLDQRTQLAKLSSGASADDVFGPGGRLGPMGPARMPGGLGPRNPLEPVAGEPLYDSLTGIGRRRVAGQPQGDRWGVGRPKMNAPENAGGGAGKPPERPVSMGRGDAEFFETRDPSMIEAVAPGATKSPELHEFFDAYRGHSSGNMEDIVRAGLMKEMPSQRGPIYNPIAGKITEGMQVNPVHRRMIPVYGMNAAGDTGSAASSTRLTETMGRKPWMRGVPNETDALNRLLADPEINALLRSGDEAKLAEVEELIRTRHPNIPSHYAVTKPDGTVKKLDRAKVLARKMRSMPHNAREAGFPNHPIADQALTDSSVARSLGMMDAMTDSVAFSPKGAVYRMPTEPLPYKTYESLEEFTAAANKLTERSAPWYARLDDGPMGRVVWEDDKAFLEFTDPKTGLAMENYAEITAENIGSLQRLAEAAPRAEAGSKTLGQFFTDMGTHWTTTMPDDTVGGLGRTLAEKMGMKTVEDAAVLRHALMNQGWADDMARSVHRMRMSSPLDESLRHFDSVSNVWKGLQTGLWPAFHVRNRVSGNTQSVLEGLLPPEALFMTDRANRMTSQLLSGKTVKGAAEIPVVRDTLLKRGATDLTDEAGTQVLRDLVKMHEVASARTMETAAVSGGLHSGSPLAGMTAEDVFARMGDEPLRYQDLWKAGDTWDPREIRGLAGRERSRNRLFAAGDHVGQRVEGMNRIAPFLHQLRQGVDPAEAAELIGRSQVRYQPKYYTPFERDIMQRLFPFYKFTRSQLEHQFKDLARHPGGPKAQVIRATTRAKGDKDTVVPDYIAETLSIPLPAGKSGADRYITGLGLMHEQPLGLVSPDVRHMGLGALSAMNPVVKAPLEFLTGKSFFQRGPRGARELEDLDPTYGRILANLTSKNEPGVHTPPVQTPALLEQLLSNVVGRAGTSLRTATDPRKEWWVRAMNLGTGVRISDVSEGSKDAILRERLYEQMRGAGAKTFNRVYFSKEDLARMTPTQRKKAEEFQAIMNLLAERAKARKTAMAP